ncbi:hypothetical protein H9P43_009661 [Blastocladiella emersonii ATCC 22665]|nr:hypothetical protein H9P43_009661 [Blastocladiella emersonii ATCC 22665]
MPATDRNSHASMASLESANMINPLGLPKGVKHECELCGRPAHCVCPKCRLTYYCDKEHQVLDGTAIHNKICPILMRLRSPIPFLGSEEERKAKEHEILALRKELLAITRTDAQKLLFEGEFAYAIPAALQALRCSMAIFGTHSIELVPSYLLLGEASIGLKQYDQAEEYLVSAKWALTKIAASSPSDLTLTHTSQQPPRSSLAIHAKLAHNFGLLYLSRGQLREAAAYLARAVFYASQLHGPDGVAVAGGYFQLGQVFAAGAAGAAAGADSAFGRVLEVWARFFVGQARRIDDERRARDRNTVNGGGGGAADDVHVVVTEAAKLEKLAQIGQLLDPAQRAECHVMFARLDEYFATTPRMLAKVLAVASVFAAASGDLAVARDKAAAARSLLDAGAVSPLDDSAAVWAAVAGMMPSNH